VRKSRMIHSSGKVPYWKIYCYSCGCLVEYHRYAEPGRQLNYEVCDVCGGSPLVQMYEQVPVGVVVIWGDERV
jgi:rRNA maturation endonuclease Nob1